jgi:hypothetical protein
METWCDPLSSLQVNGTHDVLVLDSPVWVRVTVTLLVGMPLVSTVTVEGDKESEPATSVTPLPPQLPSGLDVPPVVVVLSFAKARCIVTLRCWPPWVHRTTTPACTVEGTPDPGVVQVLGLSVAEHCCAVVV